MNQIANYNKSIHLLLISLEALDIYFFFNKHISTTYIKNNRNITCINEYIYDLFNIYNLLYSQHLHSIILRILNDYCNNINSCKIFKYIYRFEYIYRKTQYNNAKKNYMNKRNIEKIAIENLYIISEIIDQYGVYKLFHYISIIKED
uniref:Uncharacterized protein n=2 Tax=Kappaphycus TaxID=38543 RepID=A0A8E7PGZ6_9FLOR|nr:hypothetical protein [Kappaphycus striatus]